MIVRRAQAGDAPALAARLTDALTARLYIPSNLTGFTAPMLRSWISDRPPMPFFVAVDDAGIAALQMVIEDYNSDTESDGEIVTLLRSGVVFADVGAALFAATRAACAPAGFRTLTAYVADHDRGGVAYYPGLGFEKIGYNGNMAMLNGWSVGQSIWHLDLTQRPKRTFH